MKYAKTASLLVGLLLTAASILRPACAEATESPLVASLFKTYGGKEGLRDIHGIRLRFSGEIHNPWQSRSTVEATPISTTQLYAFDWAGQREMADTDFDFPGGHRVHTLEIKNPHESLVVDMTSKSIANSANHFRLPVAIRFHPILLLHEMTGDGVKLVNTAPTRIQGRTYDVLSMQRKNGSHIDILLTPGSGRIAGVRYESWAADNEHGTAIQLFSGETESAPHFPTLITGHLDSSHPQTWQYRIEEAFVNPAFTQDAFEAPKRFTKSSDARPSGVIELGKGIHLVRHLLGDDYNALVLEFKDFLAIVEAPFDRESGEELRRIVRELAPNKPIKYLVLTHHHADHIGGASALVEAGTEIVAPASSKSYIEAVLKAGKATSNYSFRGLDPGARFSIGDETQRFDIFALHGNPHADDMLFAYVPSEKLVFQADMFFFYEPDSLSYPLNERGFVFYHSLLLLGLDFKRVAGTHGVTVSRQRIEKLIGGN